MATRKRPMSVARRRDLERMGRWESRSYGEPLDDDPSDWFPECSYEDCTEPVAKTGDRCARHRGREFRNG